jgi:hypothetical protein
VVVVVVVVVMTMMCRTTSRYHACCVVSRLANAVYVKRLDPATKLISFHNPRTGRVLLLSQSQLQPPKHSSSSSSSSSQSSSGSSKGQQIIVSGCPAPRLFFHYDPALPVPIPDKVSKYT